jgi:hypothetical protein
MTSRTQRYALGTVVVSRVGFGAMQLPGPGVFGCAASCTPTKPSSPACSVPRRYQSVSASRNALALR